MSTFPQDIVRIAAPLGHFRITGKDAAQFLHRMTTNHVLNLQNDQVNHHALLDRKGKVQSLFTLIKINPETFHCLSNLKAAQAAVEYLAAHKVAEDLQIQPMLEGFINYFIVGAKAAEEITQLLQLQNSLDEKKLNRLGNGAFIWKDDRFTLPVWVISLPKFAAAGFAVLEKIPEASLEVFTQLRYEAELPWFGEEITTESLLLEAKLAHTHSRPTKGCYPGQEVVERLYTYAEGKTPYEIVTGHEDGKIFMTRRKRIKE